MRYLVDFAAIQEAILRREDATSEIERYNFVRNGKENNVTIENNGVAASWLLLGRAYYNRS